MPDQAQDQAGIQASVPDEAQLNLSQDNPAGEPDEELVSDDPAGAEYGADGQEINSEDAQGTTDTEVAFSWQASEFVQHHKGMGWYAILLLASAILIAVAAYLHSWLEIGVFIAVCAVVIVYARKPPRTLMYELSGQGIQIDGKMYAFTEFRSFAVMHDEEWQSIDLEPTKRLSPRVVMLFDPEDSDSIVGHLELHLPRHDREADLVERITRYLRF
jgi:hypothetical protein